MIIKQTLLVFQRLQVRVLNCLVEGRERNTAVEAALRYRDLHVSFLAQIRFYRLGFTANGHQSVQVSVKEAMILEGEEGVVRAIVPNGVSDQRFFSFQRSRRSAKERQRRRQIVVFRVRQICFHQRARVRRFIYNVSSIDPPITRYTRARVMPTAPLSRVMIVVVFIRQAGARPDIPVRYFKG